MSKVISMREHARQKLNKEIAEALIEADGIPRHIMTPEEERQIARSLEDGFRRMFGEGEDE